jgi:hypothetical protein
MNIEYLLPVICFWHTIATELSKYKPSAVVNNIVSFIHCISFMVHYNYDYNLNYATHMSIGFYIYDLIYMFSCIQANYTTTAKVAELKRRAPFIIHHFAGMYLLRSTLSNESNREIIDAFAILEKSNIMIYISYHLHKEYSKWVRLNRYSVFYQFLSYSYYRLFQLSLYVYDNRTQFHRYGRETQTLIIAVYCMGIVWSYRLLRKNIANYYESRRRITTTNHDE